MELKSKASNISVLCVASFLVRFLLWKGNLIEDSKTVEVAELRARIVHLSVIHQYCGQFRHKSERIISLCSFCFK